MATATSVTAAAVTGLERGSMLIKSTMEQLVAMNQVSPSARAQSQRIESSTARAVGSLNPRPSSAVGLAREGTRPPPSRLLDLQKKQCDIFGTTFNPDRLRLGNKVLRQRLKGPTLAAYYPRKAVTITDIQREFKKYGLETYNEEEEDRLEGLQIAKLRGKGAPKKKRTADTTKKGRKKK